MAVPSQELVAADVPHIHASVATPTIMTVPPKSPACTAQFCLSPTGAAMLNVARGGVGWGGVGLQEKKGI